MAEGAAVLVLEELGHATRRGAPIYAVMCGYAKTTDARGDTDPTAETQSRAIRTALERSRVSTFDVDYISAHGTSTPAGDKVETQSIKNIFGERAKQIPISSAKSSMGHLLGAAGSVEQIFCIRSILEGIIPPTINYELPDPECDLDYVTEGARKHNVRVVVNNSFGFGGQNCVIVSRKYK